MKNRKLRIGVIGAGHLGTIHTRLIRSIDDVQLAGVADPSEAARNRIAEDFECPTFADHRDLIKVVDAAIIAAPTEHHYWIGMEFLEAGVHLLIEKPITLCSAEADALIRTAKRQNLVLQTGHVERFNPAFTAAASQIHKPHYIEAVRASGYTCRSVDVGVVLDLMIHDIDLVLTLAGSEVEDVEALGAPIFGPHEDLAHARLRFANGCVANLNASRTSYHAVRQMQVFAEEGFAGIDFATAATRIVRLSDAVAQGKINVNELSSTEQRHLRENLFTDYLPLEEVHVERRNAILDEQHDFVISIRSGQKPQVTGQHGRDALAVAERVLARIAEQPPLGRSGETPASTNWQPVVQPQRKAG